LLRIRLARVGKKKQPAYRVIVADARSPRDGRYVEIVGHYNPISNPKVFEVNEDKVRDWIAKGAQPSDPVQRLLKNHGVTVTATTVAPEPAN
jgi:small subunit ribosomal protein S16